MKISIKHTKDPLMGWNIDVGVDAGKGEKISYVEVLVNNAPVAQENIDPQLDSWERSFKQKGVYPGDNRVDVRAQNQKGDDTRKQQKWS